MVDNMNTFFVVSRISVLSALCLLTTSAHAQEPQQQLEEALRVVDMLPDVSIVRSLPIDSQSVLMAAVMDASRPRYERQRALSFLSMFPDARSRSFVEGLLTDQSVDDPTLPRLALYTLAYTWGRQPDEALLAAVANALHSSDEAMQQEAARALRWVASPLAVQALESLVGSERTSPVLRAIAQRSLERHIGVETTADPVLSP